MTTPAAAAELTAAWKARFGNCPPVGHLLRQALAPRWVRFHSLPGSRRYADTEQDYALLLDRQHSLLSALAAPEELLVVTAAWDESAEPVPREADLDALLPATYWRTVLDTASAPEDAVHTHLYVSAVAREPAALDPLLRAVADYRTADVILAPHSCEWLLHPYDGGTDVIARSPAERDTLKERFGDWLSAHPRGL